MINKDLLWITLPTQEQIACWNQSYLMVNEKLKVKLFNFLNFFFLNLIQFSFSSLLFTINLSVNHWRQITRRVTFQHFSWKLFACCCCCFIFGCCTNMLGVTLFFIINLKLFQVIPTETRLPFTVVVLLLSTNNYLIKVITSEMPKL